MNKDDIFKIKLNEDLIKSLDKSGDGKISKIEWLAAMLVTMEITDEGMIRVINNQFVSVCGSLVSLGAHSTEYARACVCVCVCRAAGAAIFSVGLRYATCQVLHCPIRACVSNGVWWCLTVPGCLFTCALGFGYNRTISTRTATSS